MWCWGGNDDGQLGDGSNDDSANPVKVLNLENVQSISLGMYHSCALDDSATGWCWGQNNTGQIGDGSAQSRNEPVYVLMSVLVIDAGFNYNCAVDSGQQAVQCWGANAAGQIGNGSHNPVLSPSPVQGQLIASEVSAGGTHSCAVDSDAKIQCWGSNSHGQLGNDATDLSTIPTGVEAESHEFVEVTTGAAHTCALTVDKKVYCWGNNQSGQLGNLEDAVDPCQGGGSMCAWTPILVPNLFDVVMIVAGSQHTCAITETQQAWCWGENQWGQLGTGQSGQGSVEPTPVRVQADAQGPFAGAVDIAAESANTCIVKNDGSAWCWGINDKNQITGDSTQLYEYPVQVTDP
jgi:alpha-tubulin suppressor-like RCC1 family protein